MTATSQTTKDLYAALNQTRRFRGLPQCAVGQASATELRQAIEYAFDEIAGRPACPNTILIHHDATCWLATYVGPHAFAVAELFDGPTVATAYTVRAGRDEVIAAIAAANPGVIVKHWAD